MQKRFEKNKPKAIEEAGELFSMEEILTRPEDMVPDELQSHVSKAKRAGFSEEDFPRKN
jgi:hypothetical protein